MNIINKSKDVDFDDCFANDLYIFDALMRNDSKTDTFLKKFRCVKCIDKFEQEFSLKEIGSNFYINTKMKDTKNSDLVISNIIGSYSLMNSDRRDYEFTNDNLIKPIEVVETVIGRFKLEKIEE